VSVILIIIIALCVITIFTTNAVLSANMNAASATMKIAILSVRNVIITFAISTVTVTSTEFITMKAHSPADAGGWAFSYFMGG
jgi:hypothetical protein